MTDKAYAPEQKEKIISLYEKLREDSHKRQELMDQLDVWYNSQILGLVAKKTYKKVETIEWVKPNVIQTPDRTDQGGSGAS
jgi:hypothetical protein